jgi:hypothetical protein
VSAVAVVAGCFELHRFSFRELLVERHPRMPSVVEGCDKYWNKTLALALSEALALARITSIKTTTIGMDWG